MTVAWEVQVCDELIGLYLSGIVRSLADNVAKAGGGGVNKSSIIQIGRVLSGAARQGPVEEEETTQLRLEAISQITTKMGEYER